MRVGCARPAAAWSILSVIAARASPAADCIRLQNIVWSVQDGAPARAPAAAALPRTPPPAVCPCRTAVPLVAAAQLQLKELLAKASTCPCRPAALCQISTVTSVAGRAAEKIASLSTKCSCRSSAVLVAFPGLLARSYVEKVAFRAVGAGRDDSGELPALPVTGALKVEHAYTRSARSQVRDAYPQPHACRLQLTLPGAPWSRHRRAAGLATESSFSVSRALGQHVYRARALRKQPFGRARMRA